MSSTFITTNPTYSKLSVENPEQLQYEDGILKQTVLGGIRIEGMDRMRVTLKVELKACPTTGEESPKPPVRHNLDLYNDNQLEKFIRKIAEKLEIGTSVISASLSALTEQLEKYRLDQIKLQEAEQTKILTLNPTQQQAALTNLKTTNLLEQTLTDLKATGIQGEEENALILYLAMTSRKCHDPLSVICLARSGVGKSYLMERVAECIPEEDRKEHTQFSGNSFYYYRREEIKGMVFLIEDLDGAQAVMFPIRELQTKKRISKTVTIKDKNGKLRTVTLIVEGPVSVIGCTTREKIYEDNANRAILIYLDNSKEQDELIMNYQKHLRAGMIDHVVEKKVQQKLQHMQNMLNPIKVINPYAPLIDIPKEIFKPRRTLPLLLSFIEAITFYHQHQREQKADDNGEIYIETVPQDIAWAFKLLRDVLFRKSDELSEAARTFYEWVKSSDRKLSKKGFYGSDIRKENRIHPRTLNRYLQELTDYGLLEIIGGNKHKTGYSYKIVPNKDYETLQKSIDVQIEKVLHAVNEAYKPILQKEKRRTRRKAVGQQRKSPT